MGPDHGARPVKFLPVDEALLLLIAGWAILTLLLLIAGDDGQCEADHGGPGKKAVVFHGSSLLWFCFIRSVRLCRLSSRVEELCNSALSAGGRMPRAPSRISPPLKPMTK